MNKVNELITNHDLQLVEKNGKMVISMNKTTASQLAAIKTAKTEIVAELQRRKQEAAEREANRKAEEAAERDAIINGKELIKLEYCDDEYLSGWMPVGQSAEILQELDLVENVSGWGYYIAPKTVEQLGGPDEITYQRALELSQARKQAEEAKGQAKEAEREAKFVEARESGKQVVLRRWTTDCCDRQEDCSMDAHTEFALPDGDVKHTWTHTW